MVSQASPFADRTFPGSTIDSIVDSTVRDVPEYLMKNAKKFHVSSIDGFVRSCPVSFYETLLSGEIIYTLGICFNITGMIIAPPIVVSFLPTLHACAIGEIAVFAFLGIF